MKRNKHISSLPKLLLLISFLILLAANFVVFGFLRNKEKEDKIENRARTEFPSLKDKDYKTYFNELESFYSDHFIWRYDYISSMNRFRKELFNFSNANKKVIYGKEGWMYLNATVYSENGMDEACGLNPWSKQECTDAASNLRQLKKWCDAHGIVFIPLVCPSKHSVYPEYLPDQYKKTLPNRLDQLLETMPELIDLRSILLKQKSLQRSPLYYHTDSHWNTLGSYFALMEISKVLHTKYPEFREWSLDDISVEQHEGHEGQDLANMAVLKEHVNETFVDIVYKKLPEKKLHKVFIIHDSFYEALHKGLENMFEVVQERGAFVSKLSAAELLKEQPDVFIYEHVERYLDEFHQELDPAFFQEQP